MTSENIFVQNAGSTNRTWFYLTYERKFNDWLKQINER